MDAVNRVYAGNFAVNMREGVIWAYRLLLGREPDDEAAVAHHLRQGFSVTELREAFCGTAEYLGAHRPQKRVADEDAAVIAAFQPFSTDAAPPGYWIDFLGVRTRCDFLPDECLVALSVPGALQGPPGSAGLLHEVEEWAGTLRSVLEARGRLTVVELGAGWAPWLVGAAKAAARIGLHDVVLVGVEGSLGHVEFMRRHFADNGLDPAAHRLMHGVVGAVDGVAHFPKLNQPKNDYGAAVECQNDGASVELEEVPCISLQTLLADLPVVDLLHCDIQGMEGEVFRAGQAVVDARVRRVVIGTHSRKVEAELLEIFSGLHWVLEAETVCRLVQSEAGAMRLAVDGTQVWRNPRFQAGAQ
jgi:FkbM family methyltransferase